MNRTQVRCLSWGKQVPHPSTDLTKAVYRKRSPIPQNKFSTGYISRSNLRLFHLREEREFEKLWVCTRTRAGRTHKAMRWIGTSCLSLMQGCGWRKRNNPSCVYQEHNNSWANMACGDTINLSTPPLGITTATHSTLFCLGLWSFHFGCYKDKEQQTLQVPLHCTSWAVPALPWYSLNSISQGIGYRGSRGY